MAKQGIAEIKLGGLLGGGGGSRPTGSNADCAVDGDDVLDKVRGSSLFPVMRKRFGDHDDDPGFTLFDALRVYTRGRVGIPQEERDSLVGDRACFVREARRGRADHVPPR